MCDKVSWRPAPAVLAPYFKLAAAQAAIRSRREHDLQGPERRSQRGRAKNRSKRLKTRKAEHQQRLTPPPRRTVTITLTLTYLDVARGDGFEARGRVVRLGRGTAFAEGKVGATAQGIWRVLWPRA